MSAKGNDPMLERMTDEQLVAALRKYAERFRLAAESGKTPEASDIVQNLNADTVLREAIRRGLVDENGDAGRA
jgi:hypothetical protein